MLSTWLGSNVCLMNGWMDEWMTGPRGLNMFRPLSLRIAFPSPLCSGFLPKLFWKTSRKVRLMPRVAEKLAKACFPRIVFLACLAPTNIPRPQASGYTFGNWFLLSTDFLPFKAAFPEVWCFQHRNLNTPEVSIFASLRIKPDFLNPLFSNNRFCPILTSLLFKKE